MKKREIFSLVLLMSIFSISLASALIDIDLVKDSYYQAETLQATISGSFIDNLNLENIGVYSEDSSHKIPVESNIVKTEENTYLYYATLPTITGKYHIKIENTKHLEITTETDSPIYKNFTITSTNNSYLAINPGFIYTSKDFELVIKGYNKNQEVTVSFEPTNFKQSFTLGYGSEKTVYLSIDNIEKLVKSSIKINSYTIPAYVSPYSSRPVNSTNATTTKDELKNLIALDIEEINATLLENIDYYFQILLVNKMREAVDINLTSQIDYVKISPNILWGFNGETTLNVSIKANRSFNSSIELSSSEGNLRIPISIIVTENRSAVNFSQTPLNSKEFCQDFGGIKCDWDNGQSCSGTTKFAADGACCIGACTSQNSSSKAWIWGLVIIIILAIGGYFIYKKSEDPAFKDKFQNMFKKKTEAYETRMSPKEVKGGLTKN